jgi:RHS repeat-associated protein
LRIDTSRIGSVKVNFEILALAEGSGTLCDAPDFDGGSGSFARAARGVGDAGQPAPSIDALAFRCHQPSGGRRHDDACSGGRDRASCRPPAEAAAQNKAAPVDTGGAIERLPIDFGSRPAAGQGEGGAVVGSTDPSIALRPDFPPTVPPKDSTDVKGRWTATSRTVANPDGTFTIESTGTRLNYVDATGVWQPIDLTLRSDTLGPWAFQTTGNDRLVRLGGASAETGLASLTAGGSTLTVRTLDFPSKPATGTSNGPNVVPPPSDDPTASASPTGPAPSDGGSTASSPVPGAAETGAPGTLPSASPPSEAPEPSVQPDSEVDPSPAPPEEPAIPRLEPPSDGVIRFEKDGGKEQVTVHATENGFEFGATLTTSTESSVYSFAIDRGDLDVTLAPDGQTILLTKAMTGEGSLDIVASGVISAPVVLDGLDVPALSGAVAVQVYLPGKDLNPPVGVSVEALASLKPTEFVAVYTIDPGYLADPARVYPVRLDPTACLGEGASGCTINGTGTNFDHFVMSGLPDSYASGWTVMRVGRDSRSDDGGSYANMRGLVYFGDVALPDGAVIYDTNLALHISSEYGTPTGPMNVSRITQGWGQTSTWNSWNGGAGYTSAELAQVTTIPGSGTMNFDVDALTTKWYTRRGENWAGDLGFVVRLNSESGNGEVEFDRYNDATAANRPKLTITYDLPKVGIDFDPSLGANYAPSTMIAGQATTLPVRVSNNASGFDFTTANWKVGYRWFDAKGKTVGSGSQDLPVCVGTGGGCLPTTNTFGLAVAPPAAVGQYTLRLDIIRQGTVDTYASDFAKPSLYLSRNKKSLAAESTRWTGSSIVERDEFPIAVVAGGGDTGEQKTVDLGDGGQLGINLWSRNLSYQGAGGVGFTDLLPIDLDFGYDSKNGADCSGILKACGWATNFDERFISASSAGSYTYVGPSGTRYLVGSDGDQQLVSSAPVLLQRPRTTMFDENVPANTPAASLVVPPVGIGAYRGPHAVRVPENGGPAGLSGAGTTDLNSYRNLRFAIRTTNLASAGLAFKIHNVNTGADKWFIYTVGTDWTTGFTQDHLTPIGGTAAINSGWRSYAADLYFAIRGVSGFGGTLDSYQVIAVQVQLPASSASGHVYVDALRLEGGQTQIIDESPGPTWSSNGGLATMLSGDVATGSQALRITSAALGSSPDCNTSGAACWGTSAGQLWSYPFTHWSWKKVGGSTAAIVFHLKDKRSGAPCSVTACDLTYYAGPTAPPGAINPIQVSDVTPVGWARVDRNLLEDARQILNLYNDSAGGSTPGSPPAQGPTPDEVQMTGYRISGVDGTGFLLFDDLTYGSLSDIGADEKDHPNAAGDTTFVYDFTATYRDGSVHYFDNSGLLIQIRDRDGNKVNLDWSIPTLTVVGPGGHQLDRLHAATDNTVSGSWTYDRQLDFGYQAGSGVRTVAVTEKLGNTTTQVTGRSTIFTVATATGTGFGINDLRSVKPARTASPCPTTGVSGCAIFSYNDTTTHQLASVADPRWDQATTGSNNYRHSITWSGSAPKDPLSIVDLSKSATLLRVKNYSVSSPLPAAARVLWQDAAGVSKNFARYADVTSDGNTLTDYMPLTCTGLDCATAPVTTGLASQKLSASQFDGLARVSTSIAYRCPGDSVSGCPSGAAQTVTSRQGTQAGAKVDNFNDPLTAGQVAWTQSPDQYVSSLRDSGGLDPDLYRTFQAFDENGQQIATTRLARNENADYAKTVKDTANLVAFYRLGESSGGAVDSGGTFNGTSTAIAYSNIGAVVRDPNTSFRFNGSSSKVTSAAALPQSAYTIEAWVRATSAQTGAGIAGRFAGGANGGAFLYVDGSGNYTLVHTGTSTNYLVSTVKPRIGQFDHVAGSWDGGVLRLFVNGQLVAMKPMLTAPGTGTTAFEIGLYNGTATTTFAGDIDEVALYSNALSSSQVEGHYLAGHAIASQTTNTLLDNQWRSIQVDDQFLGSPGFESGIADWTMTSPAGSYAAPTLPDVKVHQPDDLTLPPSWASLSTGQTGSAYQDVQLLPGQTARVQVHHKRIGSTASATIDLQYFDRTTTNGTWTSLLPSVATYADLNWTGHAWDVTLPLKSDGRLRLVLGVSGGSSGDSVYFDDAAVFTTYGRTHYGSSGLVTEAITLSPSNGGGAIAELKAASTYGATATVPPIFATTVIANSTGAAFNPVTPALNVETTSTYDAWGHQLTKADQDGVTTTTTYQSSSSANGYATDVVSTNNGMPGETTVYEYDIVGNRTSVATPLQVIASTKTTTTYDVRNHALLTITPPSPIAISSLNVYDIWGFPTSSLANYDATQPTARTGLVNVETAYAYDEYGSTTSVIGNAGASGAAGSRSTSLHDLLGNTTSTTTYSTFDGTTFGGGRTTTQAFERYTAGGYDTWRPKPTGSRGPGTFAPTSAPSPLCPDASGNRCNAVATLDQDGQAVAATDAYGVTSRSYNDLGGRSVITIGNYGDGIFDAASPDQDLVSITQLDLFGQPVLQIDTLGRRLASTYDALGRLTQKRTISSALVDGTDSRTAYTGSGRVDRTSLPGAAGAADTALTWTKTLYDKAGRAIKTLAHFDTTGAMGVNIDSFEAPETDISINNDGSTERWTAGAGPFTSGGTIQRTSPTLAKTGSRVLTVTTGSGANAGTEWAIDGTFASSAGTPHTYKARVWVNPASGTSVTAKLGTTSSNNSASVSGNGSWQLLSVSWTPTSPQSAVSLAVMRTASASSVSFSLDDAIVWDDTAITPSPTDVNIPTETAFDLDGRIIASVITPGTVGGSEEPLVTRTAYDLIGRTTDVTVNEVAGGGVTATDVNLWTQTGYDGLGRVSTTIDPTGTMTQFSYDRLGRTTTTIQNYVNGGAAGQYTDDDVTSRFAYNAAGEMTGFCSAAQVFTGTCDETSISNAQAWHYAYDDAGRVELQTPPDNVTAVDLDSTRWVYDVGGRLTATCDATAGTASCAAASNVHRSTVTPATSYDAAGRLKHVDIRDGNTSGALALRTETSYFGDGQVKQVKYSEGATPTLVDTIDSAYDLFGRPTSMTDGAITLSATTYKPDGTIDTRSDGDDGAVGTSTFQYDWAQRLTSVTLPSGFSSAAPAFAWRLDGLIASRTWSSGTLKATFGYDTAKRPISITKGGLTENQTYDRDGNVASESRSFPSVSGDPGTGTQTFSYDALNRVTGGSDLATPNRVYSYDRDGNRKTKSEGGVTFTYLHDRTDQLISVQKGALGTQNFAYDTFGNLTTNAETGVAVTTSTYDKAGKLTGIDTAGSATKTAFTFDALGRFATRKIGPTGSPTSTDTYSYVGGSETVARIHTVAGATTDTDSIVDAAGNRLGVKQGSTVNWFLPDLHGNIAASLQSDEAKVSNAIRYDAWGQTVATGSQSGSSSPVGQDNWKYQGRLDVSPVAGSPLYDMSARFYSPGIGAFTQLDTVAGSAQNPLSMNRFLYAEANPATMIDPTGHCVRWQDNYCADARSGGTNAIQKQHQKKVHNDEIRRRNNANRTREYSVESRSTNRSTLTNGQIAALKKRQEDAKAAATNRIRNADDRMLGGGRDAALRTEVNGQAERARWDKETSPFKEFVGGFVGALPLAIAGGAGCAVWAPVCLGLAGLTLGTAAGKVIDGGGLDALVPQTPSEWGGLTGSLVGGVGGYKGIGPVRVGGAAGQATGELSTLARATADAAQAMKPRPGAAGVMKVGDEVFPAASGAGQALHPRVQAYLADHPGIFRGGCVEPICISNALRAGVDPAGGIVEVLRVRPPGNPNHGTVLPPCSVCEGLLELFGVG